MTENAALGTSGAGKSWPSAIPGVIDTLAKIDEVITTIRVGNFA
jgi:hypothetical protein